VCVAFAAFATSVLLLLPLLLLLLRYDSCTGSRSLFAGLVPLLQVLFLVAAAASQQK